MLTYHQFLHLPRPTIRIGLEDLHHVLLGIAHQTRIRAFRPVLRDVEGFVVVEHLEDVGGRRGGDDGGGDDLVHCFVVAGVGGVVEETGGADVDVCYAHRS